MNLIQIIALTVFILGGIAIWLYIKEVYIPIRKEHKEAKEAIEKHFKKKVVVL